MGRPKGSRNKSPQVVWKRKKGSKAKVAPAPVKELSASESMLKLSSHIAEMSVYMMDFSNRLMRVEINANHVQQVVSDTLKQNSKIAEVVKDQVQGELSKVKDIVADLSGDIVQMKTRLGTNSNANSDLVIQN